MAAGDAHAIDLLDTVHHEMDSTVQSHHAYDFVWSPVLEQLVLEKEHTSQSTWWIYSGSEKDSQIVGRILSEKLFTDHMVFYNTKGLYYLSSYWEKEKRNRLRSMV